MSLLGFMKPQSYITHWLSLKLLNKDLRMYIYSFFFPCFLKPQNKNMALQVEQEGQRRNLQNSDIKNLQQELQRAKTKEKQQAKVSLLPKFRKLLLMLSSFCVPCNNFCNWLGWCGAHEQEGSIYAVWCSFKQVLFSSISSNSLQWVQDDCLQCIYTRYNQKRCPPKM